MERSTFVMDLKRNYSRHISNAVNPNQGVGGQDELWVAEFQTKILIDNGLLKNHSLLELGCGTGRLLLGLESFAGNEFKYLGIDLVDDLIYLTNKRIETLGLNTSQFKTETMNHELDYPRKEKYDFICAFSVYTHMEPEDIFNSLLLLLKVSHKSTSALVTFLPLEHEFGKVNFIQESKKTLSERYDVVRNVAMTESHAMQIAKLAGWKTINSYWAELNEPYDNGVLRTNQSWLVLKPE